MAQTAGAEGPRLTAELSEARQVLHDSLHGLSDEGLTRSGAVGEWSVKDVLSHVTSWEEFALPDLARLTRGDTPTLASIGDLGSANYDGPNSILMALRRNLPLAQVLRELDSVHADFVKAVGRLPESVLGEEEFGRGLVKITADHDREHGGHISDWRKRESL